MEQLERIGIVLVRPRNPLNVGAAARAMANFGFGKLSVVDSYDRRWREARSAVGAAEILDLAQEAETLAEAVADVTLVLGTASMGRRTPDQPVVSLPDAAEMVGVELARGGRVVLVFGQEKHGLTRKDLAHCHRLVTIPTHERQPSMNLGQAVAVCLYALSIGLRAGMTVEPVEKKLLAASTERLEQLGEVIGEVMDRADCSPGSKRAAIRLDTRLMLLRLGLAEADARRVLGVFRRILWKLRRLSVQK